MPVPVYTTETIVREDIVDGGLEEEVQAWRDYVISLQQDSAQCHRRLQSNDRHTQRLESELQELQAAHGACLGEIDKITSERNWLTSLQKGMGQKRTADDGY